MIIVLLIFANIQRISLGLQISDEQKFHYRSHGRAISITQGLYSNPPTWPR